MLFLLAAALVWGSGQAPSGAAATGEAGGTVKFWHGFQSGRMGDAMKAAVAEFERQNPNIKVEQTLVAWGEIVQKTLTAVAAGDPPDVFRAWAWVVPAWGPEGALTPLDDFIERDKAEWKPDDFWPVTLEQSRWDGKVMGVSPSTIASGVMFYNREVFREVGYDPDKPPQTIADFDAYARKMTKVQGGRVVRYGSLPWVRSNVWAWAYAMNNQKLYDVANKKITLDNPGYLDVLSWFDSYAREYGREQVTEYIEAASDGQFGRWNPQGPFYVGQIALWFSGQWFYNDIREYAPNFDFGMAGLPARAGGNPGSSGVVANFYFMPKGARNSEGGWELLKFLSSPYFMMTLVKLDAVTPSRKSVASDPAFAKGDEWVNDTREMILKGYAFPPMPGSQKFNDLMGQGIDDVVYGKRTPAEVLKDVQTQVQKEIDRLIK
jgi:multiple sugar transport system substrate-binding protein